MTHYIRLQKWLLNPRHLKNMAIQTLKNYDLFQTVILG